MSYGFKLRALRLALAGPHRLALYREDARVGPVTRLYTTEGEVEGAGYVAGGIPLAGGVVSLAGDEARASWDNVEIPEATITAGGAMIYSENTRESVATWRFENGPVSSVNGPFRVPLPPTLLRLA
jgi:hypothetical protein